MIRFDAEIVCSALTAYLFEQSTENLHRLWAVLTTYSTVRSKAFLRRHRRWLSENSGDFSSEDLGDYFIDKLFKYFGESPSFKPQDWLKNPLGFLGQFHTSRAIDFLRTAHRDVRRRVQYDSMEGAWDLVAGQHVTPEQDLIVAEQRRAYDSALAKLTDAQKRVVHAKWQQKKTAKQVANDLGLTETHVYQTIRLVKAQIRSEMLVLAEA